MLKVSDRSWHYRLWRFGREGYSQPKDLCRYFWHILIVKLLLPTVILTLAVIGIVLLGILIWNNLARSGIVVGIIILAILGTVGLIYLAYRLDMRAKAKKDAKALLSPGKPGIVRSYIFAKKRKICPLIAVEKHDVGET